MSDEFPAMTLTGEQVAELTEQLLSMVDPTTGMLTISFDVGAIERVTKGSNADSDPVDSAR